MTLDHHHQDSARSHHFQISSHPFETVVSIWSFYFHPTTLLLVTRGYLVVSIVLMKSDWKSRILSHFSLGSIVFSHLFKLKKYHQFDHFHYSVVMGLINMALLKCPMKSQENIFKLQKLMYNIPIKNEEIR